MQLAPFLLDQWISQKHIANPPIDFDLASSTGPVWTLGELLALAGEDVLPQLLDTRLSYTSAAGTPALQKAIAAAQGDCGLDPDHIQVVAGHLKRC